jgi:hypothetical protein
MCDKIRNAVSFSDDQLGMILALALGMSRAGRARFLEEIARRLPPEPCDLEIRLAIEGARAAS